MIHESKVNYPRYYIRFIVSMYLWFHIFIRGILYLANGSLNKKVTIAERLVTKLVLTICVYFSHRKCLKHEKCFLFSRKNSFRSRSKNSIFLYIYHPSFFPNRLWLIYRTSWLKINLKVYSIIMCLNWDWEFKNRNCLIYSEVKKVRYWNLVKW